MKLIHSAVLSFSLLAVMPVHAQFGATGRPPLPAGEDRYGKKIDYEAVRTQLEGMEARAAAGKIADSQNLALWRFKLEQVRFWLNESQSMGQFFPPDVNKFLEANLARAVEIEKAKGDAAATPIKFHERAYIAPADGSAQPYWVFLPKDYSPQKTYPLVVFLHGYDPDITKAQPWLPDAATAELATSQGFILAVPYGRRNTDFLNIGEDDTLAVTDAVQKFYKVDPERVFLMGVSMGGYGVYAVGLHHPDRWAALATMAARSDTWQWIKTPREQVMPWKVPLYEADDPRTLAGNAFNLPIFLQHGAKDHLVPVEHSRLFAADLKALGYAARYREVPDGDHYIYWQPDSYKAHYDWLKTLRRNPAPKRVTYTTASLRNNRAYWVEIEAFEDYSKRAHIEAEIRKDRIIVTTQNIKRFALRPPVSLMGTGPLQVIVDGQKELWQRAPVVVRWPRNQPRETLSPPSGTAAWPTVKNPQRSGPLRDCYRDPFLLVYGTGKIADLHGAGATVDLKAQLDDKAKAVLFAEEWQRFADGVPPMKADTEVTEADRHNYNLVLFGTRHTNALLREVADKLPVEIFEGGYRVGKQINKGSNLGLLLSYPSPWDERRMLVVQSGTRWGTALPINHKFDLQPDYIVFNDVIEKSDGTNRALSAGFFDNNWQVVEK